MKAPEKPPSITCPQCGRVSLYPMDIKERFCAACDQFHEEVRISEPPAAPTR